jgi:hypothetical protein
MPLFFAPLRKAVDTLRVFKPHAPVQLENTTAFWDHKEAQYIIAHPEGTKTILHRYRTGAIQLAASRSFFDNLALEIAKSVTSGRNPTSIFSN